MAITTKEVQEKIDNLHAELVVFHPPNGKTLKLILHLGSRLFGVVRWNTDKAEYEVLFDSEDLGKAVAAYNKYLT